MRHAVAQTPAAPAAAPPAAATEAPPPTAPHGAAGSTPSLAESLSGPARADYAAARILYEDGDYAGALTKLEAAYETSKDPRLLWNMAACEKALRHYARVIDLLEQYLNEGKSLIGPDDRQATHELVQTVRDFVNELRLEVKPDGVDVLVDGVKLATTPLAKPLRLDMGKRKLRFEKPGYVPYETEMELTGGKSVERRVTLIEEVHQGTLRVVSDPNAVISVDGHPVGTGMWTGKLPSGTHGVHITAPGKQDHNTEVVIRDDDTSSLHANLVDVPRTMALAPSDSSSSAVWWVLGGVALAGAGVGTYFLLRPGDDPARPAEGSLTTIDL